MLMSQIPRLVLSCHVKGCQVSGRFIDWPGGGGGQNTIMAVFLCTVQPAYGGISTCIWRHLNVTKQFFFWMRFQVPTAVDVLTPCGLQSVVVRVQRFWPVIYRTVGRCTHGTYPSITWRVRLNTFTAHECCKIFSGDQPCFCWVRCQCFEY
jgi:hypothetical protein